MSFVKKLKDILFEEEEYTEQIKVREEKVDEPKIVKIESTPKVENMPAPITREVPSERDLFKPENSFNFPEFDEDEFITNLNANKPKANVLDYERKKISEKRADNHSRLDRVENKEYVDKKKFRPSPIISPVYGILNQDYKADEIISKKDYASTINIEEVRKKAFEKKEEPKPDYSYLNKNDVIDSIDTIETIDDPVVTFFEEKDSVTSSSNKEDYRSIDSLLEDASDTIELEDTLEIPKANNLDAIEEELEKIDFNRSNEDKDLDDTLDSDLFELIDSMYDEREED